MTAILDRLAGMRTSGLLGQLTRFAITGGLVTVLYAAIYWPLATFVLFPNVAVVIAFVVATAVGRYAHGAISFRGHGTRSRRTARRFLVVQLIGFFLQQAFTWLLVTGPFFHGQTWWPLVPAVFVVPLVTFWLNRSWAFA